MRDLRARIAQKHGIDLTTQQLQELAARRLEAILDPRTVKPALLAEMRRSAGTAATTPEPTPNYEFSEATLFESHRGIVRMLRTIFGPILRLLFNPTPIARALDAQSRINAEMAAREAERTARQTEWNALHFDVLQRLVTEVSRVSLEVQSVSARVESLVARVDFNDKRVRALENQQPPQGRSQSRPADVAPPAPVSSSGAQPESAGDTSGESGRRRRRRRRGRRPGSGWSDGATPQDQQASQPSDLGADDPEGDEPDESDAEAATAPAPLEGVDPISSTVAPAEPVDVRPAAELTTPATAPDAGRADVPAASAPSTSDQ